MCLKLLSVVDGETCMNGFFLLEVATETPFNNNNIDVSKSKHTM